VNGPAAPGAHRDSLLAGGVFVVVGIAFAVAATRYELGSALRMGPGYLPLVLGAVLTGLGLIIVGQGLAARVRTSSGSDSTLGPTAGTVRPGPEAAAAPDSESGTRTAVASDPESPVAMAPSTETAPHPEPERGRVPWARAGLLAAAVLLFGLTVEGAGLVPALVLTASSRAWPVAGPDRSARRSSPSHSLCSACSCSSSACSSGCPSWALGSGNWWTSPVWPWASRRPCSGRTSWSA
jgi:Tripartite tricarboxylate transporter TctB family